MTTSAVRSKYLAWLKRQDHVVIPRASLVPQDDPTTLFTGSGMQPLIPYLLGEEHPAGARLANSQTCFRSEDIEEVGDNRHTTFFEMLGNWSLGDYFKNKQLGWFLDFLIEVGIKPDKLYVTCFIGDESLKLPRDETSAAIWQELFKRHSVKAEVADIGSGADGAKRGIKPGERIFYYDASKNWWSRSGPPKDMPEGEPGGPDSEVFYLFESVEHDKNYGENCHPNCDCGRFLEIGNSVFMEYLATKDGFEPLPKKNVDFGGGLERIAAAAVDQADVFKIDLIWPIIERAVSISGKQYEDHPQELRVIADHLRAAVWLTVDGVMPSNKDRGYVLRRLIRRAVLKGHELGINTDLIDQVAPVVIEQYQADFEVFKDPQAIVDTLSREEAIFRQTLKKGVRLFERLVGQELDGRDMFMLYDTYGFPVELSHEHAKANNIPLKGDWQARFDELMKEQRERSRTATKGQFKGGLGGHGDIHKKYHTATHLMYKALKQVLGDHVVQRGSNITEERLRFDFNHPAKVTDEEIKQVEDIVNQQINKGLAVSFEEVDTKEALKRGALGAFGDKYGEKVKIYQMGQGKDVFSYEICGGPHVNNTAQLGEGGKRFKITKEESSSAGVRRIKAVLA